MRVSPTKILVDPTKSLFGSPNSHKKLEMPTNFLWVYLIFSIEIKVWFLRLYTIFYFKYGSYLLFTHKLYAEGSGSSLPVLLTSWINDAFTTKDVNLFPEKLGHGFMGHRILVSTIHNPPFTIRRYNVELSKCPWCIRLILTYQNHPNNLFYLAISMG